MQKEDILAKLRRGGKDGENLLNRQYRYNPVAPHRYPHSPVPQFKNKKAYNIFKNPMSLLTSSRSLRWAAMSSLVTAHITFCHWSMRTYTCKQGQQGRSEGRISRVVHKLYTLYAIINLH